MLGVTWRAVRRRIGIGLSGPWRACVSAAFVASAAVAIHYDELVAPHVQSVAYVADEIGRLIRSDWR